MSLLRGILKLWIFFIQVFASSWDMERSCSYMMLIPMNIYVHNTFTLVEINFTFYSNVVIADDLE